MSFFDMPRDPVELASDRAEQAIATNFKITHEDQQIVTELEYAANELGFLNGRYFVEAARAFAIPVYYNEAGGNNGHSFDEGLTFEGRLVSYSKVHIGKIIGVGVVRAVCMTFDSALLLPYFDNLREKDLLHVPVLSVASISHQE